MILNKPMAVVVVKCDECGEEAEDSHSGQRWGEYWDARKEEGWRCTQDPNMEWTHYCPSCA